MDGRIWSRFDEKPCLHLRLIAWATRRSEKRGFWRRADAA
jgi:hypothetical protein